MPMEIEAVEQEDNTQAQDNGSSPYPSGVGVFSTGCLGCVHVMFVFVLFANFVSFLGVKVSRRGKNLP